MTKPPPIPLRTQLFRILITLVVTELWVVPTSWLLPDDAVIASLVLGFVGYFITQSALNDLVWEPRDRRRSPS